MKVAISSSGKELSNNIAEFFGRCPYFIIIEIEGGEIIKTEILKNENENQVSGAGMSVVKFLVEKGVNVVIAKSVGPRAMDVLRQFKIEVQNEEGVVNDVLKKFMDKN